jgi:sterol desaturase/sphingolipid hydroxylase (fatty acid hydroxylase superfamily)
VPWLGFAQHPVYLFCLALVVPIIHEFHFYCIHRLIHTPFLYKWVHSVHHNSVNPSPWSSLSMHPVEHLLYLSTAFYHLIIPSNPVLALYQLHYAAFGAIPGHVGFHYVEIGENTKIGSHAYAHHLHHKYFEVNDGSAAGEARMQARYRERKAKVAAGLARKNGTEKAAA